MCFFVIKEWCGHSRIEIRWFVDVIIIIIIIVVVVVVVVVNVVIVRLIIIIIIIITIIIIQESLHGSLKHGLGYNTV